MARSLRATLKEARLIVKRDTFLRLLRTRFGSIPEPIEAKILAVRDVEKVNSWLDSFAVAKKLSDIRIKGLEDVIEDAMDDPKAKDEARYMGRTIREFTLEEGREEGRLQARRDMLLLCLKAKFKRVPAKREAKILVTEDSTRLEPWLLDAIRADKLSEVSFGS